ncbi:MAG: hypothetical protein EBW87_01495, partial [Burkholderiaceae bacterium]|nr:hypothetical protein [Burkholderiaceae bacterium]
QKRLATALENVTGATTEQIAAVEKQILKQSLATGVADDQLRPALQRLATSTGDVKQSQELLSLALDIAAAKNISVETAANALAKAYDGNNGALARLGVGLTATEIKTLGFEGTVKALSDTFGGAAATQAETFEGRIARLKVQFDETKESIGTALLPIVDKLLKFITDTAIPAFEKFKKNAIDPVIEAVMENKGTFEGLYNFAKDTLIPFIAGRFLDTFKGLAGIAGIIVNAVAAALRALEPIINAAITGINAVITAKNLLSPGPDTKPVSKVNFSNLGKSTTQPNTVPSSSLPSGFTVTNPKTTTVTGNRLVTTTTTAPAVSTITVPSGSTGIPSGFNPGAFRMAENRGDVIVNVNSPSVIDEEGFTRAVITALNNSQARSGGGGGQLLL